MKHFYYYIFVALLLCSACYEDDSQSAFQDAETITISGIGSYTAERGITVVTIEPEVSSNYDAEWEYLWEYYQSSSDTGKIFLSNEKNLSTTFDINSGSWGLVFTATNKKTGVSKNVTANLSIVTPYTVGWYVLKDDGERTDLDLFDTEEVVPKTDSPKLTNVIASRNKSNLEGKAIKMGYHTAYRGDRKTSSRVLCLISEKGYGIYDTQDMSCRQDASNYSFEDLPANPDALYISGENFIYINNGLLYPSSASGTGYYTNPQTLDEGTNYRLSPFMAVCYGYIFFDELSGSFVYANMYGEQMKYCSNGTDDIAPLNTGMTCIYMGACTYKGYGVFESKATGERKILNYSISTRPNVKVQEALDGNDRLNKASMITIANEEKVMYFVDEQGDVWSHMLNTTGDETLEFDVPADETVTLLRQVRHYYYNPINHILVGTSKGEGKNATYTIRMFKRVGGHFEPEDEAMRLTGNGYAKDANYCSTSGSTDFYRYSELYR